MQTWEEFTANPHARIGVIGIASDENSSYQRGAAEAPALIRTAFYSPSANLWSENGTDLGAQGIFVDAGDLGLTPGSDTFAETENAVARKTSPYPPSVTATPMSHNFCFSLRTNTVLEFGWIFVTTNHDKMIPGFMDKGV